jgi:DGQHR domain-containing protein
MNSTDQTINPKILEEAQEVISYQETMRNSIRILLDDRMKEKGQLPVLKVRMAETDSYMASMSLKWVASELKFAKDLDLLKKKLNPTTGALEIDNRTINEIVQRPLDWSRQLPLTIYLAGRPNHKFPVITVVLTEAWVDKPDAPEWVLEDGEKRAVRDATRFEPLDSDGRFGLLDIEDGFIYALDGQHRVIGIKGLIDLINDKFLPEKTRAGESKAKKTHTLDELGEKYHFSPDGIAQLANERVGIEVIPAVKKGETRQEARLRVRSVFTHVNKSAVRLSSGQVAQLDEDDGFNIVGRWSAIDHPFLKGYPSGEHPRVNWQNATISKKSTVFTTLQTLTEMAEGFLSAREPFRSWTTHGDMKELIPVRPNDEELELGLNEFEEFVSALAELPSVSELDRGMTTPWFRNFRNEEPGEGGKAHLLFRPIGQIALARAIGDLIEDGRDLEQLFELLGRYDSDGGFTIDSEANPWWGILYDPIGEKIARGGDDAAKDLLVYLLGGFHGPEHEAKREEIRGRLIKARSISDEDRVINYDGTEIHANDFRLPAVIA